MSRAGLFPILIASLLAALVAIMGATVTDIGPWYHALVQPRWAPPDAAYGVAWIAIYALSAMAGVYGWIGAADSREREWLLGLFAANGFLNIVWSLLFFRFHRPDWSEIEAIVLWLSVLALILTIWRRSMTGALLLIPYLAWVTFAGYLNLTIVRLNGPFS